jgi:hypothetical protein
MDYFDNNEEIEIENIHEMDKLVNMWIRNTGLHGFVSKMHKQKMV